MKKYQQNNQKCARDLCENLRDPAPDDGTFKEAKINNGMCQKRNQRNKTQCQLIAEHYEC